MSLFTRSNTIDFFLENANTFSEKKQVYALEEADVKSLSGPLIYKLYQSAISKSYIDFGGIEQSKGDITKYTGYTDMMQCISYMENICRQANKTIPQLNTVSTAINNIAGLRSVFTNGFALNKEFLILQYNTLTATCVEATSCLIASFVEYTKKVDSYDFTIITDKTTYGANAIKNLETFNKSVTSGDYAKVAHLILKTDATKGIITEGAFVVTATVLSVIVGLVILMREIVFRFFYSRMKVSEYLKMQSAFLEINRASVEAKSSGMSPEKKKKVLNKQEKLAKKLMAISDKIKVEDTMSGKKASTEIKKDNTTMTLGDVQKANSDAAFDIF